jgi:hypothetical protein
MIEAELPFCDSTARRLMMIARDPRLADRAHVHVLPPHWATLYELTKLSAVRFADGLKPDALDSRWRPLFYPKVVMLAFLSGVRWARALR